MQINKQLSFYQEKSVTLLSDKPSPSGNRNFSFQETTLSTRPSSSRNELGKQQFFKENKSPTQIYSMYFCQLLSNCSVLISLKIQSKPDLPNLAVLRPNNFCGRQRVWGNFPPTYVCVQGVSPPSCDQTAWPLIEWLSRLRYLESSNISKDGTRQISQPSFQYLLLSCCFSF